MGSKRRVIREDGGARDREDGDGRVGDLGSGAGGTKGWM
jgi:hypothetical protein